MTPLRRYRDIVLVVLLLAVPFFFLRASIRRPEEMNAVDRMVISIGDNAKSSLRAHTGNLLQFGRCGLRNIQGIFFQLSEIIEKRRDIGILGGRFDDARPDVSTNAPKRIARLLPLTPPAPMNVYHQQERENPGTIVY